MSLRNASNSGITSCPLNALTKITMLGLITLKEQVSRNGLRNEKVPILLELIEIELDVVDPIDGTESLSLDHLQCLYEWLQSGVGS